MSNQPSVTYEGDARDQRVDEGHHSKHDHEHALSEIKWRIAPYGPAQRLPHLSTQL